MTMPKKETKKTSKTSNEEVNEQNQKEQNELNEVKKRAVSTGKKKDWKDEENEEELVQDEEEYEQDQEAVSDPENELDDQDNEQSKGHTKRQSIFDKLDLQAIEQLDKEKLSGLSNQQLFEVLYARGMTQQNPPVYHAARKALLQLSLQPMRPHHLRRNGPPPRQRSFRGRGGSHQGNSDRGGHSRNSSFQKKQRFNQE